MEAAPLVLNTTQPRVCDKKSHRAVLTLGIVAHGPPCYHTPVWYNTLKPGGTHGQNTKAFPSASEPLRRYAAREADPGAGGGRGAYDHGGPLLRGHHHADPGRALRAAGAGELGAEEPPEPLRARGAELEELVRRR